MSTTMKRALAAAALTLLVAAPLAAQAPAARRPQQLAARQIQGFNVVLVLAETSPASAHLPVGDLPPSAQRAIQDMREFLPFKSYRVLDSQWTSCCAHDTARLSGMLRGVAAVPGKDNTMNLHHRPYGFHLEVGQSERGLAVRFELMLETADEHVADGPERTEAMQQVLDTIASRQRDFDERGFTARHPERLELAKQAEQVRAQMHQADRKPSRGQAPAGRRATIDSSFSMDPGETVVVGTSRLGGDKALIALVTAVKRTMDK